jgi:glycerophosphoryl diester phosphodiesterase
VTTYFGGYLDSPGPIALAHRGGGDRRFENTMRAFDDAVSLGYRYIETDLRATSDGVVLTYHDAEVEHPDHARRPKLAELTYAEVRRTRVGGSEEVPRLVDVLAAYPGTRFNIDFKDRRAVAPAIDVLRATNAWKRVCLASFSRSRLTAARALVPAGTCSSASAGEGVVRRLAPRRPVPRDGLPYQVLQVPFRIAGRRFLTPAFVRAAHDAGLKVHAWTINSVAEMDELLDVGVDGIITDETATLRSRLEARGAWD